MRYFFNKETEMLVAYDPECDSVTELKEIGSGVELPIPIMRAKKQVGGGSEPSEEEVPVKKEKKGAHRCRNCQEYGHNAKTCKFGTAPESEEGESVPAISPLTPVKLAKIKKMLGEGESQAVICDEVGVSEETVERVATQLGL